MASVRFKTLVHGNAVFMQFPGGAGLEFAAGHRMDQVSNHAWTDVVGERQGPGVVFRGNARSQNFFHVAIPSPTTIPAFSPTAIIGEPPVPHFYFEALPQLINVFFEISADPGVVLNQVFAFDGASVIPGFPQPVTSGPGSNILHVPGTVILRSGLGLSFDVTFSSAGNITFHSAGAEFQVNGLA